MRSFKVLLLLLSLLLCSQSWADEKKKPLAIEGTFNSNVGFRGSRGGAGARGDKSVRGYLTLKNLKPTPVKDVVVVARYISPEDKVFFTEELKVKVGSKATETVNLYWANPGGAYVVKMTFDVNYKWGGESYEDSLLLEMKNYEPLADPEGY